MADAADTNKEPVRPSNEQPEGSAGPDPSQDAVEPPGAPGDTSPNPLPEREDDEKTYDAAYVKKLREEAADRRKATEAAEERAKKAEERARDLFIVAHTKKILADPEDLLAFDPEADLYDEDGELSEEKVVAAATALTERKKHLAARTFGGDSGAGPRGKEPENKRSFNDILKDAAG